MMKLISTLVILGLASSAFAQRCPINSQDANSLAFGPAKAACSGLSNPPSASACDSCGEALFRAFAPVLPRFGLSCETFPTDPGAANSAITNAITPCVNVVLPALNRAGVPVNQLLALNSCPQEVGPLLTSAVKEFCPNAPL